VDPQQGPEPNHEGRANDSHAKSEYYVPTVLGFGTSLPLVIGPDMKSANLSRNEELILISNFKNVFIIYYNNEMFVYF
jgi:hypothetical protein